MCDIQTQIVLVVDECRKVSNKIHVANTTFQQIPKSVLKNSEYRLRYRSSKGHNRNVAPFFTQINVLNDDDDRFTGIWVPEEVRYVSYN